MRDHPSQPASLAQVFSDWSIWKIWKERKQIARMLQGIEDDLLLASCAIDQLTDERELLQQENMDLLIIADQLHERLRRCDLHQAEKEALVEQG